MFPLFALLAAFQVVFAETPLTATIKAKNYLPLKRLIQEDNIPVTADDVKVMLMYGTEENVRFLLENGGKKFLGNTYGQSKFTALMLAIPWSPLSVIRLLICEYGVKLGECDINGNNVLHIAAYYNSEILQYLLKMGGNCAPINEYRALSSSQHSGAECPNKVHNGGNAECSNDDDNDYDDDSKKTKCVVIDVFALNKRKESPLMFAMNSKNFRSARYLLLAGADITQLRIPETKDNKRFLRDVLNDDVFCDVMLRWKICPNISELREKITS